MSAPTLSSAIINAAGTSLTLTYNEALDTGSTPATGAFSLAGTARTVSGVNVTGSTVVLTLSGAVAQGATVTVSYTAGGSPIQDSAGNDAANLTNQAVTNNSTVFIPNESISGLVAWFDMQDASSYTNTGGFVSAITNKASAVSWTEATFRPAVSATGLNGLPCMDLDGTNDRIISTEAAVVAAMANQLDYYLAMVVQADDLDAIEAILGTGNSAQASAGCKRWGTNTTGNGKWTVIGTNDTPAAITIDSTGDTVTTPVLLEFYSETQATSIRVNGAAAAPSGTASAYGTLTPDRVSIGCRPVATPASFFDGRVGEILFYGGAVSEPNKALARAHLITKWTIS